MSAILEVEVADIRALTPLVREFTLVSRAGPLPAFSAGSHIQVHLPLAGRTLRNAYSLCSDPDDARGYRIAVRLQESSRGGSRYMHEQVRRGDRLRISGPANLFQLHSLARHHLLIAGGIGITPFLAHVGELERRGADFELHHAYRGGLTDAFAHELSERLGSRFHGHDSQAGVRMDLGALLRGRPLGTHVYVCGPSSLIEGVQSAAAALGWPQARVHSETFVAAAPGVEFEVDIRSSGRRLAVPADISLLEALEQAGVEVPSLCRGGVCGQCVTRHLRGDIEHRDHYLRAEDRQEFLLPCVSRGCGAPVLLDL